MRWVNRHRWLLGFIVWSALIAAGILPLLQAYVPYPAGCADPAKVWTPAMPSPCPMDSTDLTAAGVVLLVALWLTGISLEALAFVVTRLLRRPRLTR